MNEQHSAAIVFTLGRHPTIASDGHFYFGRSSRCGERDEAKAKLGGYLRFKNCGFSDRTIRALLAGGVATPERLPSMTPDQVRLIRGIGPALMKEVERYRAQFWNARQRP